MTDWKLIKTAPTNGEAVLAWQKNKGPFPQVMYFDHLNDEWTTYIDNRHRDPTHWMALPDAPIVE